MSRPPAPTVNVSVYRDLSTATEIYSVIRPARDNRLFVDAVFCILRTGAPWRDLPADSGDRKNTHSRFCRWRDRGVWEQLWDTVVEDPGFEWLLIDASYVKVHPHGSGARRCNQAVGRTQGG